MTSNHLSMHHTSSSSNKRTKHHRHETGRIDYK